MTKEDLSQSKMWISISKKNQPEWKALFNRKRYHISNGYTFMSFGPRLHVLHDLKLGKETPRNPTIRRYPIVRCLLCCCF
jgi:hypothetical protein